ncbi:hypothetical protein CONCODRAFT_10464 [Conidiobolus coronatus NRRL 28638]|uniref:UBX-domain-containing protein n=1 Tax=Conidiobolus coronatus (strain ATCC 28846 / CBS 209.66 / NRRL 28638) TaxID=796925 RepID=A0A137NXB9_CONC2|nr:hypothetical protein CONCODRAFT_10464 [Conidiobolus coronatus NRRL 28638]|eukprot:KXN67455.1 hypothetical protein CONCODRAFT_10464 [Conidiobolus coronatus NRRL 28638]
MASDLETLVSMGFPKENVEQALKATRNAGLQPAIDWLVAHPDGASAEELNSIQNEDTSATSEDQVANSLVCQDCGKQLRDTNAAEVHAAKTGHVNFGESIEAVKQLTPEEKAARLEALKVELDKRKRERLEREKQEEKEREKVRRASGREITDAKAKFEEQEMKKLAELKKKEKDEEKLAKKKILEQIEADKKERLRKREEAKQLAAGIAPTVQPAPKPVALRVNAQNHTQARIQIKQQTGANIVNTFEADALLSDIYEYVSSQTGIPSEEFSLSMAFPRKVLDGDSKSQTLKDLGLVPSASLMLARK